MFRHSAPTLLPEGGDFFLPLPAEIVQRIGGDDMQTINPAATATSAANGLSTAHQPFPGTGTKIENRLSRPQSAVVAAQLPELEDTA